jgi:hypothetical protein
MCYDKSVIKSKEDKQMKKNIILSAAVCSMLLAGCGANTNHTKTSSSVSKVSTSKVVRSSSVKPDPNASERKWTYKNNVFDAGNETYKFTGWDVMDSANEGKKVLVLYCDVTNNSTEEMDPSNVYMVVHAYQKNETSNVQLDPGMVELDENGNDPLQQYEDGMNNRLLPGKTVKAVMLFEFNNDNTVQVEFSNPEFETIGIKNYKVSKKLSKADREKLKRSNASQPAKQSDAGSQTKKTVDNNNTGDTQAPASDDQASDSDDADQVDTAQPSQGGTIYQTDNDGDGFKGDPDAIADTQQRMLEGIK